MRINGLQDTYSVLIQRKNSSVIGIPEDEQIPETR
jgi:hypothetical protein